MNIDMLQSKRRKRVRWKCPFDRIFVMCVKLRDAST